jgi:hypothetical protein
MEMPAQPVQQDLLAEVRVEKAVDRAPVVEEHTMVFFLAEQMGQVVMAETAVMVERVADQSLSTPELVQTMEQSTLMERRAVMEAVALMEQGFRVPLMRLAVAVAAAVAERVVMAALLLFIMKIGQPAQQRQAGELQALEVHMAMA